MNIASISVNEIIKESHKRSISEKAIGPEPDSISLIKEISQFILAARVSSVNPILFFFFQQIELLVLDEHHYETYLFEDETSFNLNFIICK